MAVLMTATLYCMLGSMGAARLLDILARLYIFFFFSVFFVILWYEEEKDYLESGLLCRTQTCFSWVLTRYAHLHASPLC